MKYLLKYLKKIKRVVKECRLFLFLDYDGTLTPIVSRPHAAVLSAKARGLLASLSRQPDCQIAIMSGRILRDIKKRIQLKKLIYGGNHGLEIHGPTVNFQIPLPAGYRKTLRKIKLKLIRSLRPIKGIIIEDKQLTLGVHYRMVSNAQKLQVEKIVYETTFFEHHRNMIKNDKGKMVLEIKPPVNWDKGKAVLWLLRRHNHSIQKTCAVYLGDDRTDEDAFRALKNKGLTVYVGPEPSKFSANYYLKDERETLQFLKWLLAIKTPEKTKHAIAYL